MKKIADLGRRFGRSLADMLKAGIFLMAGIGPVSAEEVIEEHGKVYAKMASVEQVCSFLASPTMSALADLRALDREVYDQSFREFSATMNLWLVMKTKSAGLDDGFAAFPSADTRHELSDRFNLCFGLNSNDTQFLNVLKIVFDNRDFPPSLGFLRPYFGAPEIDLEALVFMASMEDGATYLSNYLKNTEGLITSRVETARQSQAAQSSAAPTGADQSPDGSSDALESVMGGQPVYVQYACEISLAEVLGVPDLSGDGKVAAAEIGVKSDGSAIINGKLIQPANVFPAPAGTDMPFNGVVYGALDIKNALFSNKGLGTGLLNPSQDELQDFQKLTGMADGLTDSLLNGRTRYLAISLANSTIFLTDVTPDGKLVNRNTPRCSRSQ
ncbi:hypothetical protein NKI74_29605 [Mesorhizobium sp. M0494]|uniref:hypothetical protein n=1 Tax=Mesorhizobium sp. M0494 TaxID=2956951 RepID=UPI00333A394E